MVMDMIENGLLPQNINPPPDIMFLSPKDYLKWVDSLPDNLGHLVMHLAPSCSIETLSKEVCLERERGSRVHPKGPRGHWEMYPQEPHGPPKLLPRQEMVVITFPPPFCADQGLG